jgi:signal transduction histidine kinase
VEFIKDNPYPSLTVNVDGGRLQQVLTNFMTNSVKYTHQGHIKLGYRKEQREGKDGLYLYCEDTGEGIAKENQDKIFDRFYKVNDFIQGTGLGLAICKAIADASNGAIGVESEGQGTGTTFWIWVPINE